MQLFGRKRDVRGSCVGNILCGVPLDRRVIVEPVEDAAENAESVAVVLFLRDVCKCTVSFCFRAMSHLRFVRSFGVACILTGQIGRGCRKRTRQAPFSFRSPVHPSSTRSSVCCRRWHSRRSRCKCSCEFFAPGNRRLAISVVLLDHLVADSDSSRPAAPPKVVSSFTRISCTVCYYYCIRIPLGHLSHQFYVWFTFRVRINMNHYYCTPVCHS